MLCKYFLVCLLSSSLWHILSFASVTQAQIIPDNTLNNENSVVSSPNSLEDDLNQYIEGGAIRGSNLFHSFLEFNVSNGGEVYFASPTGIDNIITRVTGNNLSNISGKLGILEDTASHINGGANLFLLNPNGVVFGQNSQLDITGSFLATTADSYIFENDFNYSASNPETPSLLMVDIPIGLQFGSKSGTIINRSRRLPNKSVSNSIELESEIIPEGLRILSGENLSLIGGEVILEGGYINTSEGIIELGAVEKDNDNIVKLIPQDNTWSIEYSGVESFADIKINQQGGIDGGIDGGTQINLTGKNIGFGYALDAVEELGYETADFYSLESLPFLDELAPDETQIIAHNHNNSISSQININASDTFSSIDPGKEGLNFLAYTFGQGDAGNVKIAGNSIILYGASVESSTLTGATGNSGAIDFIGRNMSIQHGGGGVNTFSQGDGGLIHLDIEEEVKIQFGGFGAEVNDIGDGGIIRVDAEDIEIIFGGFGVTTFASGDGGTIDLNIANNLKVTSGGFGADTTGKGNGGKIEVDAQNIELINAGMGVNAFSEGSGGEINIQAETILFKNGVIGAESGENIIDERQQRGDVLLFENILNRRNAGNGGSIFIEAQDFIIDRGNITTTTYGTGNGGNIELQLGSFKAIGVAGGEFPTGINSFTEGAGSGGEITIDARNFRLSNGARVAADSSDIGQAGNITINSTNSLELFDQGEIVVNGGTNGIPGNINIQSRDIVLERDSIISADTTQGIQGNITISGDSLSLRDRALIITNGSQEATGGNIFIYLQKNLLGLSNSQITANAENGQGGSININTRGLFFSADSQIDASSEFGIDGLIEVDTFTIDQHSGLIQLPTDTIDPSLYLSQGCSRQQQHEFISVGRGGLPKNPLNTVVQNIFLPDLGDMGINSQSIPHLDSSASVESEINSIVEAQSWKINHQGKVELTANLDKSNVSQVQKQISCLK